MAVKLISQALQAPACHENMVKVGGYILGEFGNLIAGDQRSSPLVQFQLLHSKVRQCVKTIKGLLNHILFFVYYILASFIAVPPLFSND